MRSILLIAIALPAFAHVVSMSTGDARLAGSRLDYELRMPLYEISQLKDPAEALLANIHFYGGGDEARVIGKSCLEESGTLLCKVSYLFPRDVEEFHVKCSLWSVTVPNHIHLLRAVSGAKSDQFAFDASFSEADLRFRPPTPFEIFFRAAGSGFWRAVAGPAQVLFLVALLLAARGFADLGRLFAMFAAGQLAGALAAAGLQFALSPRFIEAAAALTIAYLAVELLMLPEAGGRWAVTGILGLFHGLYFSMLFTAGDYSPALFLTGALAAEALLTAIAWYALERVRVRTVERALASVLLVIGLSWFLLRLRN